MKILIAADHAGFDHKQKIQKLLPEFQWIDLGPSTADRVDYPDFAEKLSHEAVKTGALGVLICGTGIGMSITANKVKGIRAAVVENPVSAKLSREHNHANVLCLGSRILAPEYAAEIIRAWVATPGSNDPRHVARIKKISEVESK